MNNLQKINLKGYITYEAFDVRTGKKVDEGRWENQIVGGVADSIRELMAGEGGAELRPITHIGWGGGLTPTDKDIHPLLGWTDSMEDPQLIKPILGMLSPVRYKQQFNWELTTAEGNDFSVTEWALLQYDGVSSYNLFSRIVRENFTKTAQLYYKGTWVIEISI